jgi:uncharacterized membrane protein
MCGFMDRGSDLSSFFYAVAFEAVFGGYLGYILLMHIYAMFQMISNSSILYYLVSDKPNLIL